MRQGKQIHASQTGRAFIDCLPKQLVTPDMTAKWESALNSISLGEASYQEFMTNLEGNLNQLLQVLPEICRHPHYTTYRHQQKILSLNEKAQQTKGRQVQEKQPERNL